mgnify:CR=1 FL=1
MTVQEIILIIGVLTTSVVTVVNTVKLSTIDENTNSQYVAVLRTNQILRMELETTRKLVRNCGNVLIGPLE